MHQSTSPKVDATAHDFNPTVYHYIPKSAPAGSAVQAICGQAIIAPETFGASASSNGVTVICPLCAMIYADLPEGKK